MKKIPRKALLGDQIRTASSAGRRSIFCMGAMMNTLEPKSKNKRKNADEVAWFSWDCVGLSQAKRLEAISLLLRANENLLKFVFDLRRPRLREEPRHLLKEASTFAPQEKLLVQAGVDIWQGEGKATLADILKTWDDENIISLVRSLCHLKQVREEVMHHLIDDERGGFCL